MHFTPNEDQAAFFAGLDQFAGSGDAAWKASPSWDRFDWSASLDKMLEESGFFECAAEETLGLVTAAAMTSRLARLPVLVECAASSMLRVSYTRDLPRPLAVVEGDTSKAIPFLPVARSVIRIAPDGVKAAILGSDAVEPVESLFAYPMGKLRPEALEWSDVDADADEVRDRWRMAVAAELTGVLQGGLDAVVAHVRDRRQGGMPLGSFQAVQHGRGSATAKIEAAYWLTLKATQGLQAGDTSTALGYVQDVSTKVVYDLHQFMGAMGLTLEHPLHRWTYRARLLRSSLGGADGNLKAVADSRWGTA